VSQAESQLALKRAGALPSDIAAQEAEVQQAEASVDNINASIQNNLIVAPFSGTVASVHAKIGDSTLASTPILSLNPESALQITLYLSELDVTKVRVGDAAEVTLDAYGGRVYGAQVISVDSAPSHNDGTSHQNGYKVTLQFLKSDPSISSGMTANVTIALKK
jgi:multidrug resistance efflux pump